MNELLTEVTNKPQTIVFDTFGRMRYVMRQYGAIVHTSGMLIARDGFVGVWKNRGDEGVYAEVFAEDYNELVQLYEEAKEEIP